ncbi:MAG: rane dipeptidase [Thermoleophilaceae bacterium]|jgi:membrane dipeptidase|nr:rane dipeptidase [Thermoleophilaceae bacterium]
MTTGSAVAGEQRADELHRRATVINGLTNLLRYPTRRNLEFPLPEIMRRGGVTGALFTMAVTEDFKTTVTRFTDVLSAMEGPAPARVARTADDLRAAKAADEPCVIFGFQGSEPLEGSLTYLDLFHRLGLRVLQLTYQRRNLVGDGCGEPADGGLSVFGRTLVRECNELGILVDLSHVGYQSSMDTIEHSEAPVAFTHVNMHAHNPMPRNKTDEQIKLLAERGGVVGINAIARLLSPHGEDRGATMDEFVDQIEHVVQLVGPDAVGIGLDVNEDMSEEDFLERRKGFLKDFPELSTGKEFPFQHYYVQDLSMGTLPKLTQKLVDRGYSDEDILKILGGNFLRLFDEVWKG